MLLSGQCDVYGMEDAERLSFVARHEEMEMAAFTAVRRQIIAFDLEGVALGPESPDLGLSLIEGEKAGFAGATATVVLWGIQTKKGVDREATRGYKPAPANESPYSPQITAPTRKASYTC